MLTSVLATRVRMMEFAKMFLGVLHVIAPVLAIWDSSAQWVSQISLRKHAYSNILKILQPEKEKNQIKILIFFLFLFKT